eukprot:12556865-Ditylum_brightwellii.AAC.1
MSLEHNQVALMTFFLNEQCMAFSNFQISSCFEMALDIIKSGPVEDNENAELNHLVFKCNKMLSDIWQKQ